MRRLKRNKRKDRIINTTIRESLNIGSIVEDTAVGKPSRIWEDNIWMDIKEIVDSSQDRYYRRILMSIGLNLRIHRSWS